VLWPAGVTHGAWTEHGPMRVFGVEFAGSDDSHLRGILEGVARRLPSGAAGSASRGEGRLAPRPVAEPIDREGEPT